MVYINRIIIMGIPHHRNIGDNAIAVAEEELLNNYFSDYEILQMPEAKLAICVKRVKNFIQDDDIIMLHGGGNIGDTYMLPEEGRRTVIETFPNNKIIVFPQTAFFSDTEEGNKQLELSKKIYNNQKNLVILAREKKSYEFMKKNFYNAKVYLTPDIVMTLKKQDKQKRNGALILFRNDREKVLSDEKTDEIIKIIKKYYKVCKISDMSYGQVRLVNVAGKFRKRILNEKYNQLQSSEIVITDRLHGMIFAAITETPCIALKNFNHKILESYDWLKDLKYIRICENVEEIENIICELKEVKDIRYDNTFAINSILEVLNKEIRNKKDT